MDLVKGQWHSAA